MDHSFQDGIGNPSPKTFYDDATIANLQSVTSNSRLHMWHGIVEEYSKKALSRPSDVLPALAVVAQSFNNRSIGQYSAGLWSHGLPAQLNWKVRTVEFKASTDADQGTYKIQSRRPEQYCAPSWSWASVLGPITFQVGTRRNHINAYEDIWDARVNNVTCKPSTSNEFGSVGKRILELDALGIESDVIEMQECKSDLIRFTLYSTAQEFIIDSQDDYDTIQGQSVWVVLLRRRLRL